MSGVGADISGDALKVAKENGKRLGIDAIWKQGDLFEALGTTEEVRSETYRFDLIVSNPPYICTDEIAKLMPEVRDFEPMEALDGKEDGLYFYRKIIGQCKQYLNPEGHLLFEIGYDQGQKVSALMREIGFHDVQVIKDLARKDRVVTGML